MGCEESEVTHFKVYIRLWPGHRQRSVGTQAGSLLIGMVAEVTEMPAGGEKKVLGQACVAELAVCCSSCVNVHSQQHVLVMCATAFYLIENYPLDVGPDFSASIIQVSSPGQHPH